MPGGGDSDTDSDSDADTDGDSDSDEDGLIFPLDVGNTWTYEVTTQSISPTCAEGIYTAKVVDNKAGDFEAVLTSYSVQ